MSYEYRQYIDQTKEKRRELAAENGMAWRKRFLLSAHPELRQRLRGLREAVVEFKKRYPGIVALGLYGSMVKGYATSESDVDAVLFWDSKRMQKSIGSDQSRVKFDHWDVLDEFTRYVQEKLSLNERQLSIKLFEINKDELKEYARKGFVSPQLFFLSLGGREINEYRRTVLEELESMGDRGERIWKDRCRFLCDFEWLVHGSLMVEKRKKLYPWTIAEAKRYFFGDDG